jgi:DNA primase
MNNNVEEIKARLNIVDVVGEYVRLTKAGANWKGLCPFHGEKSPSFMVNEEKQIFHCFGCTKGGDVFTFVQEIESLEFREVLKLLAEKAGVELQEYKGGQQVHDDKKRIMAALELATKYYEKQLQENSGSQAIKKYLHERGINDESILKYRLGYAPSGWDNVLKFLLNEGFALAEINKTGLLVEKSQDSQAGKQDSRYYDRFRDRIMFPITDAMGGIVGYSARVTPGQDETQAKYINSPESLVYHKGKALYGIFNAKGEIKRKNYVLLVEGNLDVIAAAQAGIGNVVAVSGTALTPDQLTMLKRYTENIAMLFDMDAAGQQAAQKSADLCLSMGINVKIVTLTDGKDAADVAVKDPNLLLSAVKNATFAMEYFFAEALEKYDRNSADGKRQIVKEILSHVSHLESTVEKAHWIKKVAHQVDVEEKVIGDVLQNIAASLSRNASQTAIIAQQDASFQKRSDIVRDSLAGAIMSSQKIWKIASEQKNSEPWAVGDAILKYILKKGPEVGYSFDVLLALIEDPRAAEKLRKIYFETKYRFTQDGVIEYGEEDLRQLMDGYIAQYVKELQKEKLHVIIKEIETAEQKGDKETLAKLMSEFTKLSQEMQ